MKNSAENPSRLTSAANDAFAQLAQQQAVEALVLAQTNAVGSNPAAVATANIPNPVSLTAGVVMAFATVTPKMTGKFRVRAIYQTAKNGDVAAQTVLAGIGHAATAPTIGTTVLTDDGSTSATPAGTRTTAAVNSVAINGSASEELIYLYGQTGSPCAVGAFTVGTPVSFALVLSQSVASAFALAAGNAQIEVQELP